MITFEHVTKCYPGQNTGTTLRTALSFRRTPALPFVALDDVSLHLAPGGALGVVGGNGAGKSTLLKLLTRVTRPDLGRIVVRGRMSSLLEVGAGFHTDLSGRENIFLAGAILGISPRAVRRYFDAIVDFSGLSASLNSPVRTYSSGMFLRLAFSVGVHLECDILVIDEALAVGDRDFQTRCLDKIQAFKAQGGTLVLVSHDEHQLLSVCEEGILLERGRLCAKGSVRDVLDAYHGRYPAL